MKLKEAIQSAGFIFEEAGENALRITVPFTFGNDGADVSFYVLEPDDETYSITDAGGIIFLAASLGMDFTKSRINSLNDTYSIDLAKIDDSLSIVSRGKKELLVDAIWDTIKLIMAIIFHKEDWQRKFNEEKFRSMVFAELQAQIGRESVVQRIRIKASSGHEIEFPIGIHRKDGARIYVTTLATENGRFNWGHVYQTQGRFHDVKAISDFNNRLTIIEQGSDRQDEARVQSYLSDTSLVHTFNKGKDWRSIVNAMH